MSKSLDRTLSGATTQGQSGPGSDGNKGILHIPLNSRITRPPPSDCFCVKSRTLIAEVLSLCRDAVSGLADFSIK